MTNIGDYGLQLAYYPAYPQHSATKSWVRLNMKLPYQNKHVGISEELTLQSTGRGGRDYYSISKVGLGHQKSEKGF